VKIVRDQPCASCPYRRDARLEFWHPTEFLNLLSSERDQMGTVFGCHEGVKLHPKERSLCIGWLIDQRERGVPSIRLRMLLMQDQEAVALLERANADGMELYTSIESMCRANRIPVPNRPRHDDPPRRTPPRPRKPRKPRKESP
jgi:hypothetical protein